MNGSLLNNSSPWESINDLIKIISHKDKNCKQINIIIVKMSITKVLNSEINYSTPPDSMLSYPSHPCKMCIWLALYMKVLFWNHPAPSNQISIMCPSIWASSNFLTTNHKMTIDSEITEMTKYNIISMKMWS